MRGGTLVISVCGLACVIVVLYYITRANHQAEPVLAPNAPLSDVHPSCPGQVWNSSDDNLYKNSVTVIYDFSTMLPESLKLDLNNLSTRLNQDLVSQIFLLQNNCDNEETKEAALVFAKEHGKVQIILIDSDKETVSRGRARIEAIDRVTTPFMLFLSANTVATSKAFIENMLLAIRESPNKVVVPALRGKNMRKERLTWALNINRAETVNLDQQQSPLEMPLVNNEAFMIRTDLYKTVGGYDKFFYKNDDADRIAFSLALWLCGGSIVMSTCASIYPAPGSTLHYESAIKHLQHAKYIQQVFGGGLQDHFTFPGIEFYKPSAYDNESVGSRQTLYRECLNMEWYALKFHQTLPYNMENSKFYNAKYDPMLPVYNKRGPRKGRWFVLFAGHCIMADSDSVLGMAWCPIDLTPEYIFVWQENGQVKCKDKCVTVRDSDKILVLEDCKGDTDTSQLFSYDKTQRTIKSRANGECVTHMNGAQNRQLLQLMECKPNSLFTQFILSDEY